eukprot:COSAG04_NODE_7729_length_1077_cov_1.567485_1_plen_81_part_10
MIYTTLSTKMSCSGDAFQVSEADSATNRELDVSLSHHVACLLRDLDRSGNTIHEAAFAHALAVAARVVIFGVEESLRVALF